MADVQIVTVRLADGTSVQVVAGTPLHELYLALAGFTTTSGGGPSDIDLRTVRNMAWFMTPHGPQSVVEPATITEFRRRDYLEITAQQAADFFAGAAEIPDVSFITGQELPAAMAAAAADDDSAFAVSQRAAFDAAKRAQRVLAIGTSITFGQGASDSAHSWAALLPAQIVALQAGAPTVTVTNAGASGDTSAQMLARLPALLANDKPGTVLIETSINDARADLSITTAATVANVRAMVALVRLAGSRPIVATSAPIDPAQWQTATGNSTYTAASATQATATNAAIRTAIADLRAELVDLETAFAGSTADLTDGVHPNDTGHAAWALAWARVLTGAPVGTVGTQPAVTLATDDFNRADSTTSIGGAWDAPVQGTWGISGNQAYDVSNGDDDRILLPVGQADHAISVTTSSAGGPGLIVRAVDGSNYYMALFGFNGDGTGGLTLFRRVASAYTEIGSATLTGASSTPRITLAAKGSTITCSLNGTVVLTVTDGSNATGTRVGFRGATNAATRWEDLSVLTT